MLMLKKPPQPDGKLHLRTVIDSRERNANTRKLASPLPEIDAILRNVASHKYRSLIDGKDAYEQIRVIPEHVDRTLFTTPDGSMVSHVMQLGDCNGGATYQALMNYLFAEFIGVFMDVYLDDVVVYSDTAEDHVKHVKIVIDILKREKLFLSDHKLHFFVDHVKTLGHIIDDAGIAMDPEKVDKVSAWKTPTNRGLLMGFLGAVGYLAPGCGGIRIPMGLLAKLTGSNCPWRWSHTEQRTFEEVKDIVQKWRDHHRVAPDYLPDALPFNLSTDACCTGASGVLSQGNELDTSKIISFWSGKFSTTQQNYPVHEQELLAIVESLKRFRNLLHGVRFRAYTDHKALQYILTQRNLSPRQQRWMDLLNEFDFEVIYIPGETNVLPDALSRIYSADPSTTLCAPSEYVSKDDPDDRLVLPLFSAPILTGEIARAALAERAPALQPVPDLDPAPFAARRSDRARKPTEKALAQAESAARPARGTGWPRKDATPKNALPPLPDAPLPAPAVLSVPAPSLESPAAENLISEDVTLPVTPPRLTEIVSSGGLDFDFPACVRAQYSRDKFFVKILMAPEQHKNYALEDSLIYLKQNGSRVLCIPDIFVQARRLREILISHAHSILAHLGARKTSLYLRDQVWWPKILDDVKAFCESCQLCQQGKARNHKPYGLLTPLPVLSRPWETIGIDFVGPLPESSNRHGAFDMICVIIDHLTAMVHLTPSKQTYRAQDIAEIIFDHVYKLHGLPSAIVSDRDSLFTSLFWARLHKLISTKLKMSTSYHPQTDGATERANRTMTQMLRMCVDSSQRDWVVKLPAIEFAINSARSETTGYAPFVLNNGYLPRSMLWSAPTVDEYPGVRAFAQRMKDATLAAHDAILTARVKANHQC